MADQGGSADKGVSMERSFSWLRHTKRREGAGSIPSGFLGNFQENYLFLSHSAALHYTQPLTEMSTKEFPLG
jgi:hypothetical protein